MAGLNLGAGAFVRAGVPEQPRPTTATQAAFGTEVDAGSGASALAPNTPAGVAVAVGVLGVAFLLWVYWSLPG